MDSIIHIILLVMVACFMLPLLIPFIGPIFVATSIIQLILFVLIWLRVPIHWVWKTKGLTFKQATRECREINDEAPCGIWGIIPALALLGTIVFIILGFRLYN